MADPGTIDPGPAADPAVLDGTGGVNRLQQYISDRLAELGIGTTEAARRSGLTRQHIDKLLNEGRQQVPPVETLDALAAALQVPRRVLRQIAAEAYGYVVSTPEDDETRLLTASLEELPESRRRDVAAMIRLFREEADEQEKNRRRRPPSDGR